MTMLRFFLIFLFTATTAFLANAQDLTEIRQRMKERRPHLEQLRQQQLAGENNQGYVTALKELDAEAKKIVDQENADRKGMYTAFAAKFNQSLEQAAQSGAKLFQQEAGSGTMVQTKEGEWKKK